MYDAPRDRRRTRRTAGERDPRADAPTEPLMLDSGAYRNAPVDAMRNIVTNDGRRSSRVPLHRPRRARGVRRGGGPRRGGEFRFWNGSVSSSMQAFAYPG